MEVLISSLRKRSQFLRIAQKGRKFSSAGLILQMHKLDKVTDAKIQKGKKNASKFLETIQQLYYT